MRTKNEASNLLPQTGENYPSGLIEASSHIRTAAHLVDEQLSRLPDLLRADAEIFDELSQTRDTLWSAWTSVCEKITLILASVPDEL